MTIKLIGILLVFISCTACGFVIDWQENNRLKELEKFIMAFERLRAEIEYKLAPLEAACLAASEFNIIGIRSVFKSFAVALRQKEGLDIEKMWKDALDKSKAYFHLKDKDYEILQSFADSCGYLDKKMQEKNIDMVIARLQEEVQFSKSEYQKKTKMNKTLGMLIGACISIFLI